MNLLRSYDWVSWQDSFRNFVGGKPLQIFSDQRRSFGRQGDIIIGCVTLVVFEPDSDSECFFLAVFASRIGAIRNM